MIDSPCHGCGERAVGCHAACERYKAYADRCKSESAYFQEISVGYTAAHRNNERWAKLQKKARR